MKVIKDIDSFIKYNNITHTEKMYLIRFQKI